MWQCVIGLEIHAQILSQSKLFTRASTEYGQKPNRHVALFDMAMPGTLPVLNKTCVAQGVRTGLALKGTINVRSTFERKQYFYPDLPAGYQISQLQRPLVQGGFIMITDDAGNEKKIRIDRLHLEQDAGKNNHDVFTDASGVDFNRAGIGLMEIVSCPDMSSAREAGAYVRIVRALVQRLGTCDGNMQEGSFRVDANISLHHAGQPLGTPVEVKNINSVNYLERAITYEIERQTQRLNAGDSIVRETRLFNEATGQTSSMRLKEEAAEYRYFPEPNLPDLVLDVAWIDALGQDLPELPQDQCHRWKTQGVPLALAEIFALDQDAAHFFDQALTSLPNISSSLAQKLAHGLASDVFGYLNKRKETLKTLPLSPQDFAHLMERIETKALTSTLGKRVLDYMIIQGCSLAQALDHFPSSTLDADALSPIIATIIKNNSAMVKKYLAGKEALFEFFVGQIMKETRGQANPAIFRPLLQDALRHADRIV